MGAAASSALTGLSLPQLRLSLVLPGLAQPRAAWLGAAALGLAAAAALGAAAWSSRGPRWRRRRRRLQRRLRQVGTVAQLWIYPIKSCKGVPVNEAECTAMGLRSGHLRDRFWLIINEEGNMVTARQEPRLVLISLTCENDSLILSAAYTQDLILPIKAPTANVVRKCRVHGLGIEGRDCGDEAAQWITNFLKTQSYRLVYFEPHMRPRNSKQIQDAFRITDKVAYPDASPFLILSEASLADLNSRLEKKVKANNFRPNIVISGCGIHEEDSWNEILIGDVEMKRIMACGRCILTTVDPDTGIMNRKEPLETLRRCMQIISYRQEKRLRRVSQLSTVTKLVIVRRENGTQILSDPTLNELSTRLEILKFFSVQDSFLPRNFHAIGPHLKSELKCFWQHSRIHGAKLFMLCIQNQGCRKVIPCNMGKHHVFDY
ncbi:mitochondrial amidoxime-reducing component 1-like isoform X1 [Sarcophilus harrisii]|uniref:mitochondrial amidoxime-reducing component 1-like isoform X1 n=1 Tax=Sarcophilus harrisii TaxID=9305 RepID=UPI001301D698|nr:mitochondrial amidoxime-reducing component 1-like isoform X1 [Sarcophilus harrisii]